MRRRDLISLLGGAVAAWLTVGVRAQPGKTFRLGILVNTRNTALDELFKGLRDHGYIEGQNLIVEYRFSEGVGDRWPDLARELVALKVDAIVVQTSPAALAAKQATSTIPIVIAVSADPVAAGLVQSLGHPGGNTTGLSLLAPETDEKTLELLKETLPKAKRVVMIFDPKNQGMMLRLQRITAAAPKLAIELQSTPALSANELAGTLTAAAKDPPDVLIVLSPIYAAYRDQIVQFATKTNMPLTMDTSGLAEEPGAILSYGADISDLFRRAATFVDKILKGAKPADLPVEQPVKFEFVINLKTATALGLDVPPMVLMRTDKVIE